VKIPLYDSELTEYSDKENCFQVAHSKSTVIILQADNELKMHEWYDRLTLALLFHTRSHTPSFLPSFFPPRCNAIVKQKFVIELAINSISM
jgi:hypothetical protein